MLDQATREKVVDALFDTYRSRTPMPLPTKTWPGIEVEDAYRIQQAFIARKVAAGGKVKGYKVGLTSKPMQEFSGTNEPDFSAVTDDFFLPESTPIPMSRFFAPMIEMEIAVVMKEPLKGPGVLPVDVIRATDFVLPAIEIVDFRVQREPGLNVIDNIADLAFCGAVVLGANPRRLDQIDIRRVQGALYKNGNKELEGEASAVLGNPVTAVAWLANKLGEFGTSFQPGDTILTGSFIRVLPVAAGDEFVCRFDQGLGEVATSFE
ncbi:fumarylacetoacetate hydrolase family protein [Parvibaculum sp.]|uniref:2-keto-4-pentenoate hydratase n=1 Tax=Parvibaculum sp. TaxID=2024848 RepID=UPI001B0D71E0|nr:fumarylacetoacetate hydrolase family protein [Parvibaculum sp.]MBO6667601.1 fumarylacetoacetate hydrolase family protein [Parvibaculum sp.]MBO6693394.1 fumarylacetoacetate hydrolase family protein [Parvibaculum sp.]MBO6714152.1 fumarylacetoacetate hydrolase family protein [Parvibaculum sp.]